MRVKYFIYDKHICSFTSMLTSVSLVWQSYIFKNVYLMSVGSHKYFTFGNHVFCFTSLMYSLFGKHICLFFYMPITLTLYGYVSIHNTNPYNMLIDSHKYFKFGNHIFSLIHVHLCTPCLTTILVFSHLCQ